MKCNTITIVIVCVTMLLMAGASAGQCQEKVPAAPDAAPVQATPAETYRLRVENAIYGRVEVSVDGGEHYLLVGRVQQPAAVTVVDKTAFKPGVALRSSGDGVAFSVAPGQALKLLPVEAGRQAGKAKVVPGALMTDGEPRKSFFTDLLPPPGSPVLLQLSQRVTRPFTDGYVPSTDDVFVFPVTLAFPAAKNEAPLSPTDPRNLAWQDLVRKRWEAISQEYAEQSVSRARALNRKMVSGLLTLHAKLPAGEPEPITAVTYSIDGDIVSAQNTFPSAFAWDTRRVPNGEHVIEIRALSKYASVITKVRALVLVQNPQP